MLKSASVQWTLESLLSNRRGTISPKNVTRLFAVFIGIILIQCCVLYNTVDYISYYNISTFHFLSVTFIITGFISLYFQKTWRYVSYFNQKRVVLILFQSALYTFSFWCLIKGLRMANIGLYYSLLNIIAVVNILAHCNLIFSSAGVSSGGNKSASQLSTGEGPKRKISAVTRVQLFLACSFFVVAFIFWTFGLSTPSPAVETAVSPQHPLSESIELKRVIDQVSTGGDDSLSDIFYGWVSTFFGIFCLCLYHFVTYIREQHADRAQKKHKVYGRIQPLALLGAALFSLILSGLTLTPDLSSIQIAHHEGHNADPQMDEKWGMFHNAAHESDDAMQMGIMGHGRRLLASNVGDIIGDDGEKPEQGLGQLRGQVKQPKPGSRNAGGSSSKSHASVAKSMDESLENNIESNPARPKLKSGRNNPKKSAQYAQQMQELQDLIDGEQGDSNIDTNENVGNSGDKRDRRSFKIDPDKPQLIMAETDEPPPSLSGYAFWSLMTYLLFVVFFVLLNPHLLYLQARLEDMLFATFSFDVTPRKGSVKGEDMNDILSITNAVGSKARSKLSDDNRDSSSDTDTLIGSTKASKSGIRYMRPRWTKFIVAHCMVTVQFFGVIFSWFIFVSRSDGGFLFVFTLGTLLNMIAMELGTRVSRRLGMSAKPYWLVSLVYLIFGSGSGGGTVIATSTQSLRRTNICGAYCSLPSFIQHLREERSSRRIFIFLSLNFAFMFVEFAYGYWSNSLGLISDACHMLFDCIALAIGLSASYLGSQHAPSSSMDEDKIRYSYGHGRIKVISGFVNGVFLIYIGISVLIEAMERVLHPPHIHTDQLLLVSFLGLLVNLVGLFFFHDAHMHGHDHGGGGGHSHGHSHSHEHGHGHSHGGGCQHDHDHDHNIRGIFLHVLADTLGSVGVIISSILIHFFDWTIADALCSVFIALLIYLTVYPLISSTTSILLQITPSNIINALTSDFSRVVNIPGVVGYRLPHFWEAEPGRIVGSIHVQISEESDEQQILSQLSSILTRRFNIQSHDLVIQIEKQYYLDKIDPIHHSVYNQIIPIQQSGQNKSSVVTPAISNATLALASPHSHSHAHHHSHDHSHDHHHHDHGHDHDHEHEHDHDHDHDHSHDHHNGPVKTGGINIGSSGVKSAGHSHVTSPLKVPQSADYNRMDQLIGDMNRVATPVGNVTSDTTTLE